MPTGTMETFNVPRDLLETIQDVVGRNTLITMATMVQYEIKPEKFDHRVLVLTNYRVMLLTNKTPCKVELSTSFINIHALESKSASKLTIALEGRRLNFSIADEKKIDKFIIHIVESLATAFPRVDTDQLIGQIEVSPPSRHYHTGVREVRGRQDKRDPGPCGGFSLSYRYMCDYHGLPYMADVVWDIDTIYMTQDCHELCLSDFDHLDSRHLLPIVSALEYNHWFTSLNANNIRLHPDVLNCIPGVMRRNSAIEQLHLSGIGLKSEFIQRLSITVSSNPSTSLVHLDLSGNPIEDRGLSHLCGCLSRLPKGLTYLDLSQAGLTAKGVNRLAESLCGNTRIADTLTVLNLARNAFRTDDVTNLFNFLAQPNALTMLNLSGTDCCLDTIFGALLRGSCQKLEHLDLSHNPFLTKKVTSVQQSCKQFFGSAISLRRVDLSFCRLPGEAVKFLLLGLGSNPIAKDVEVNLSGNNLGHEVATLEMCLPDISNITTLDLSDNALDVSLLSLIPKLGKNRCVKKLLLGKNFGNIKSRNLSQILEFLTAMIHEEDSSLESLSLAGSKLRAHTNIFINALGGNSSLKEVDISGNLMGDAGARMLAKALQINNTLTTVSWDHNSTSPQGFSDIADALEKNYSIRKMPLPLADVMAAMKANQEKTEHAIQQMESFLQRNHSPRKFASDQGYRLQQGFLINALQQMLDRAIVTLQATAKKLEVKNDGSDDVLEDLSQANFLVKDAGSSRHLLAKFQDIALKSERDDSALCQQLRTIADDVQTSLEAQVKKNMEGMLSCATDECPTLLEDDELSKSVESGCREKSHLTTHFMQGLVVDQLGTDIFNKLGELNLGVATHMSDQLIEGVLRALNKNHEKLLEHLRAEKAAERAAKGDDTRTSVLRKKSSVDDELSSLDVVSISNVKRKSVYSRKLRPQSSLELSIASGSGSKLTIPDTVDTGPKCGDVFSDSAATACLLGPGSPRMEPRGAKVVMETPSPTTDKVPTVAETSSKDVTPSSPVPAPRKRKSAILKASMSCESTPGTPPLPIVHEKSARPGDAPTVKSPSATTPTGQAGMFSTADSLLHDLDVLSRKHAAQKEYVSQDLVSGASVHVERGPERLPPAPGGGRAPHVDSLSRPVDGKARFPPTGELSSSPSAQKSTVDILSDYIGSANKHDSLFPPDPKSPTGIPEKKDETADLLKGIKVHKKLTHADLADYVGAPKSPKGEKDSRTDYPKVPPPKPRPPLPSKNHRNVNAMKEEVRLGRLSANVHGTDHHGGDHGNEPRDKRMSYQPQGKDRDPPSPGTGKPLGPGKTPDLGKTAEKGQDSKGSQHRWDVLKQAVLLGTHEKREAPQPPGKKGVLLSNMNMTTSPTEDDDDDEEEEDEVYEPRSEGTDSTDLTEPSQPTSAVSSPLSSRESTPSRGSPVRAPPAHMATLHPVKGQRSVDKPDKNSNKTPTPKSDKSSSVPVASLKVSVDSGAPKLEHLAKARPRPPRTRAVTRAGVRTEIVEGSGLEPGHSDVSEFFDTKEVSREVVATSPGDDKKVTSPTNDDSKQDKKKGWFGKPEGKGLGSLFSSKKTQSVKNVETTSKKLQSPQKLAGVKEGTDGEDVTTATRDVRSHSPDTDLDRKSGDELEEPELEEPKKPIAGLPKGGLGMMGGNALMAEMQAKRRSMQPLASKTKPPATDGPRESVAPAKAPPGGRPLFPPGEATQPPGKGAEDKPKLAPLRPRPPLVPPKPSRNSVSPSAPRRAEVNSSAATTAAPSSTGSVPATSSASSGSAANNNSSTTAVSKPKVSATVSDAGNKGGSSGGTPKPEAVEECDKSPSRPGAPSSEIPADSPGVRKRLSVREKAAALDKNRNEYDSSAPRVARRDSDVGRLSAGRRDSECGDPKTDSAKNSRNSTETSRSDDSQSRDSKAKEAEPKSNGSTPGRESKEEFLMYL